MALTPNEETNQHIERNVNMIGQVPDESYIDDLYWFNTHQLVTSTNIIHKHA